MKRLSKVEGWKMRADVSNSTKFCELPKVHKEFIPLWSVVSLTGAAKCSLARGEPHHSINNAQQFLGDIKKTHVG